MKRLSKSRVMSALQCPKRLHLEIHRGELAEISPATQSAFDTGHKVGEVARQIYGQGAFIEYDRGLRKAIRTTEELMSQWIREPIYEATFVHGGVLVRVDVLLPEGDGWRIVEVKASTKVKDEHLTDATIQAWVFQGLGYTLESIAIVHVDTQWVYQGDGDYRGLLAEEDITAHARKHMAAVPTWIKRAQDAASPVEPTVAVGAHCRKPYDCPFFNHCWPNGSDYPITGLGGGIKQLAELVRDGYRDIRDVPLDRLSSASHRRIWQVTHSGEPELQPEAAEWANSLAYPRYYLDFETIAPAVPVWPGTRPYETLPVQWSCHIEDAPGDIRHEEFLDLSGEPPMRALAEAMIDCLGDAGPILMYTTYEKSRIEDLAERFPDLKPKLDAIVQRLVDLYPETKSYYYHPDMLGSWSIKAVMPTIPGGVDFKALEGIQEGTAASEGYLEAIQLDTPTERREELEEQLRVYCRLDTQAMVALLKFLESSSP